MDKINEKVYEKGLKLLAVRFHSLGELYRKLKQRGFKDQDIQSVLRKLEELKFLDDRRFAEIFVESLKSYKDFGYYGIKAKLLARQLPNEITQQALAEFLTIDDELEVAKRLLGKLQKQGKKDWEKLASALQRRGFRSEVIRKVLRA